MSEASAQSIVEAIRNARTTHVGKTVADVEAWLAINLAQCGGDAGSPPSGGDSSRAVHR